MKIKNLILNNIDIPLTNMVIIVGSNSSGKTRLLEEINSSLTGRDNTEKTNFWSVKWSEDIKLEDLEEWYSNLIQFSDNDAYKWYSPFTRWDHQNKHDGLILENETYLKYTQDDKNGLLSEFGGQTLAKEYINYLPVYTRLNINVSDLMTPANAKPNSLINILNRNPVILPKINKELDSLFKKRLELSRHRLPNLELKMVDSEVEMAPKFDLDNIDVSNQAYNEWLVNNNVLSHVSLEGHGIQAFLHILLAYFIPLNHVLLIDEPEIHLYPSVKRKFGNSIGNLSKEDGKQFFCVTHDSDFLQGIFDSKCEATILRIKKVGKSRELYFKSIGNEGTYYASQTQTPFLQIPFLDAVVIVEGATDRLVYERVFFENSFLSDIEYKFISAGGKDGITNPDRIANDLNVPRAIIFDIENLKQKENHGLLNLECIKVKPVLGQEIEQVGMLLIGIPNLLKQGVNAIKDPNLLERVRKLINSLKKFGIFIVYKGTLESWSANEIKGTKNQTVEVFIEEYLKDKEGFSEMVAFLKEIEDYLKSFQ